MIGTRNRAKKRAVQNIDDVVIFILARTCLHDYPMDSWSSGVTPDRVVITLI